MVATGPLPGSGVLPINDPSLIAEPVELEIVSSSSDPEYAAARSAQALADVGGPPKMEAPPAGHVVLPGGVFLDGELHQDAIVKELTGAAEERLARIDPLKSLPLYLRSLLEEGVEYLGGKPPSTDVLDNLLVGDREMLILAIRQATYGDDLPMHLTCPVCEHEDSIVLELNVDIPIKKLDAPEIREYDVDLRDGKAVVTLATAAIQDKVIGTEHSDAERKTLTLQHCVKSINGIPSNYDMVLNLGLRDRATILNFLADKQPGPDYGEVSLPCSGCKRDLPINLSLADLFRS